MEAQSLLGVLSTAIRPGEEDAAGLFGGSTVLHVAGRSGLAGRYEGADAILDLLHLFDDLVGGKLVCSPTRIMRFEQHVIIFGRLWARSDGVDFTAEAVCLLEFRDRTIDEIWMFSHEAGALDRLSASRTLRAG